MKNYITKINKAMDKTLDNIERRPFKSFIVLFMSVKFLKWIKNWE